ncbi:hypothetical protein D3C72_132000 [compost metagenome]
MKAAYFDCFNGASETMLLGALLDAGADVERLRSELTALVPDGCTLSLVRDPGAIGVRVDVLAPAGASLKEMKDVVAFLQASTLSKSVQERTLRAYHKLALAEAKLGGTTSDRIFLREYGALECFLTVVAVSLAVEMLGVAVLYASPLPMGSGLVRTAQGMLPNPQPLVVEILAGVPVYDNGEPGEKVTPLAAAMLATMIREFGALPAFRLEAQGWGRAGSGSEGELPRALRVLLGQLQAAGGEGRETVSVIETNIDDANPQFYEYVVEKLFAEGAQDVFLTPVIMKRGRPGIKLTAIAPNEKVDALGAIIFAETPSIGIRTYQAERQVLSREIMSIRTDFGPIRVKVSRQMGAIANLMPEYKDCVTAARSQGVPLKVVWQATVAQALQEVSGPGLPPPRA